MTSIPEKIKKNMIFVREQMSIAYPRIVMEETARTVRFEADIPHPVFNSVITYEKGVSSELVDDIHRITDRYRELNVPFTWLTWSHDAEVMELRQALETNGLEKVDVISGMSLSLADWTYKSPAIPGLVIKQIQTHSDMAWFRDVVPLVFNFNGEASDVLVQVSEAASLGENAPLRHYAGFLDGRLAAAATAVHDGEMIGIYNVATLEAYRRIGLGSAMTAHALREGQAAGRQLAVLLASKMGENVYRTIGFSADVTIEVYWG